MSLHPKVVKDIDGVRHVSVAGVLLLAAGAVHGAPGEFDKAARQRAQVIVDALLSAAHRHGFTQSGILETLLATDRESDRCADLAIMAINCIGGGEALSTALSQAGFNPVEGK